MWGDGWENNQGGYIKLKRYGVYFLKGQCHEIFDPRFFSSNNPL
jgi:hypothetical protein